MKIALTQFAPKPGQLDANRERACDRVREAAACGCDLVVFPELFTVGYFAFDAYEAAAEALDGETVGMLSAVADEHDIAVLTGTFIEDLNATTSVDTPADTGLANTAVLLNRSGEIRLWYRKQHLFGYQSEEADRLVAGETIETAPLRGATVGITTCYDLRFPELYRAFQDAGATLMLVPSAWPSARPMHWRVLTRARAIENQWYLIAVNGAGTIGTTTLLGQSRAYDPWGEAIAALGRDPGMTIATVDPDRVPSVRTDFPILDDRRLR